MVQHLSTNRRVVMCRKKVYFFFFLSLILLLNSSSHAQNNVYPEIHCKHFFYGYPTGTPQSNDLIIRDIYALSSNDDTKLADWVAYRLDKETIGETKNCYPY